MDGSGQGLDSVISSIMGIFPTFFFLIVIIFSIIFIKDRSFVKLLAFLGLAGIVGIFLFNAENLFGEVDETDEESDVVDEEEEPIIEEEPIPSEPVDWQPLIWVAAIGGGLLLIGGTGYFSYKLYSSTAASRKKKKENKAEEDKRLTQLSLAWLSSREKHKDVLNTVAQYETDIALAIDYPAFNDISVGKTSDMVKSMRKVEEHWRILENSYSGDSKGIYGDQTALNEYSDLVSDFETKVAIAERNAKQMEWNKLSVEEQKDLKTAKFLLKHASDPANTKEVRHNYMSRLNTVVKRVNERHKAEVLPQATILVIEDKARLMLTDGAENNVDELLNTQKKKVFEL